ncbi:CRISPR-associated endonuclease Cas2 [Chitinispirillales bacterium ANBcel5]|uniref:CRISPR-associated endonuclease Cas2 n=1 Tax=Cellulosispirillum alkaliphilum TaxID=3039283 RepID=UPI002A553035|nr:CRISPR-associated endonuclease Cas2 [Chitinispirillales bacterium ANBcel5]
MKYVIAFDISDDNARYRAVKILLQYCYRVQKSVFEGVMGHSALTECLERLGTVIDSRTDSLRCYQLCAGCSETMRELGNGPRIEKLEYLIL